MGRPGYHRHVAPPTDLLATFRAVRARTEALAAPLSSEDQQVQSMPDASPTKWHLAHSTWFFETFVLRGVEPAHEPFHAAFDYLFNSYYEAVGPRHERARRGLLSRPPLADVMAYRHDVDARVGRLVEQGSLPDAALAALELGLHHEQQHQELILTDAKHALGANPLLPAYLPLRHERAAPSRLEWLPAKEEITEIGHDGRGFAFDNEGPRHRVVVTACELASRLVTCAEYLEFMSDGGYERPGPWLSDGWDEIRAERRQAPLYWASRDGAWHVFTLAGERPLDPHEPACHLSFFEADAYARWAGARLPTEQEWERAARDLPVAGNFAEDGRLHPSSPGGSGRLTQVFGDCWEWTSSAYRPYPGYRPTSGALGEYNGKFMSGQMVLRGGSCLTPRGHVRATYRNFFPPGARWQCTGLRLARDK
jgi:ergothioneine biosynthesis protein EgtB